MMTNKEFYYAVEEEIRDFLPEKIRRNAEIMVAPVMKNNDTTRYGLCIRMPGECVAPNIYLEGFFKKYQEGEVNFAEACMEIITAYEKSTTQKYENFSLEPEQMKERVIFQLVNEESNKQSLDHVLHESVGNGLVKKYVYLHGMDERETATIALRDDLLEQMNLDPEEMKQLAEENTKRIFPPTLVNMESMLGRMMLGDSSVPEMQNNLLTDNTRMEAGGMEMYVLSNSNTQFGASSLYVDGVQEQVSHAIGDCSYFVLPSSIHECIILPDHGESDAKYLQEMVRDVNSTMVSPEEILSDKAFRYDKDTKELSLAVPEERTQQKQPKVAER